VRKEHGPVMNRSARHEKERRRGTSTQASYAI
jgi:hypothetical protein